MRAVDIIQKKRDNIVLPDDEIKFLLDSYLQGKVPDYQISAFCMAVYFNGMTAGELKTFTEVMMNSGDLIEFPGIKKFLIDKHSTGGVGDKTTISLAPVFASFNIGTAKLSGRGLGHTGGTIDKFESIPGFTFPETKDALISLVNKTGIGIMGYSDKIVPLDKKLYSLRDVTATVPSIPLIASSIMSKKLAVHADGIILDVKVGSGAFMKDIETAGKLAEAMLEIGTGFGRKVVIVLSDMDQPLGNAVGNSNEVLEAVETLSGKGPSDFTELVETLAAIGLMLKGDVPDIDGGKELVWRNLKAGKAHEHLKNFVEACGGDSSFVDDLSLKIAPDVVDVVSDNDGFVNSIETESIGKAAMILGAGRAAKDDVIDHSVGVVLMKKKGSTVKKGDVIAKVYHNNKSKLESVNMIKSAYKISGNKTEPGKIILDIIRNF
ncbi:MAG: thymidine phosphorylase [Spirochaetes bacterium]|nr:thymidine phosphorylase [Spirochaetota bacterium]